MTTQSERTTELTSTHDEKDDRTYILHKFHKVGGLMGHSKTIYTIPFLMISFTSFKFDENGMNFALPNIQTQLDISESTAQWLSSMYFIACASLAIPLSRYAEQVGYVNLQISLNIILFLVRLAEFFISLYVKNSQVLFILLVILRFFDGGLCGGLTSSRNSMVAKWPNKKNKANAFNLVIILNNIVSIINPIAAGYVVDYCGYQYKFLIDAILCVLVIFSCFPLWEHKQFVINKKKFDILGSILLAFSIGFFCLALTLITKYKYIGFALSIIISIASLIGFIFAEKKHQDPILPLSIMKNPIGDLFMQNVLSFYIQVTGGWIMPQLTSSSAAGIITTGVAILSIVISFILPLIKKKFLNVHILIIAEAFLTIFCAIEILFVDNITLFIVFYLLYSLFNCVLTQLVYPMTNTALPPAIVSLVSGLPTSSRTIGSSLSTCISAAVVNLIPDNYNLAIQIDLFILVICGLVLMFDAIFRIGVARNESGKLGFQVSKIREVKLDKVYEEMIQQTEQKEKLEAEQLEQQSKQHQPMSLDISTFTSIFIFLQISVSNYQLSGRVQTPGPGAYRTENYVQSRGPQYSLYGRPQSKMSRKSTRSTPGPDTYRIPDSLDSTIKYSIRGRPQTTDQIRKKSTTNVGPQTYNVDPNLFRSTASYTISGRINIPKDQDKTPGPQKYHVEESYHYGTSTTISGRPKHGSVLQNINDQTSKIGPNTYKVEEYKLYKNCSYSISGRTKTISKRDNYPGPGAYNIDKERNHGASFSMSGRTAYFGFLDERK